MFPQQQATWTRGPSFPRLRPDATANTRVMVLIIKVHLPRYPRMMNPLRMVLIYGRGRSEESEVLRIRHANT